MRAHFCFRSTILPSLFTQFSLNSECKRDNHGNTHTQTHMHTWVNDVQKHTTTTTQANPTDPAWARLHVPIMTLNLPPARPAAPCHPDLICWTLASTLTQRFADSSTHTRANMSPWVVTCCMLLKETLWFHIHAHLFAANYTVHRRSVVTKNVPLNV